MNNLALPKLQTVREGVEPRTWEEIEQDENDFYKTLERMIIWVGGISNVDKEPEVPEQNNEEQVPTVDSDDEEDDQDAFDDPLGFKYFSYIFSRIFLEFS